MTKKAKTTDPKPVVTMEEHNGKQWIYLNGRCDGKLWPDEPPTVFLDPIHTAAELRAIADFLDQLEGADLLSQVTE